MATVNRMPRPMTLDDDDWQPEPVSVQPPQPIGSGNALRPMRLDEMVGQDRLRALLRRVIDASLQRGAALDHMLLTGPAGVGKTTIATIVANELGTSAFAVEAPVSHETLLGLRTSMHDGDVLFIDEVHQQAIMERRGRSTNTQPEVLFSVMEDATLVSGTSVLEFPRVTVIGATTDEGMLPNSFVDRFPLRPSFEDYTISELGRIAYFNAAALGLRITPEACVRFAMAARGVPRLVNNYVRNAESLGDFVDEDLAMEVIGVLNSTTDDGLNIDMQKTLVFLYTRCKRISPTTGTVYQASVATLATAIGKSRDTKAIALRVEPYLIKQGYLQVGHGGRKLTDLGVERARELIHEGVAV